MAKKTTKMTTMTATAVATAMTTTTMADAVGGMATTGRGRGEESMTEQNTTIKLITGEGGETVVTAVTMMTKATAAMNNTAGLGLS